MEKIDVLALIERGDISVDDAKDMLAAPEEEHSTRPIWRLRLRVGEKFRLWLPWPPLALLAAALLTVAALICEIVGAFNKEVKTVNLWGIIGFIAQMSFTGGGLFIEVDAEDNKILIEM